MSVLNEDFFDNEDIIKDVSSDEEQENISLEKENYWYMLKLDCSDLKMDYPSIEDFKKKWLKMFKAVPFVLRLNDFIEDNSEIRGYLIHVDDSKKTDFKKNNYRQTDIAEIYSAFKRKKFITIYIACLGLTFYRIRDKRVIRGVENITKWFAQCFNNMGMRDIKSSFWITFDNQEYYKDSHISVNSLPESSFKKIKFVESLFNRSGEFFGNEYTANKQFGKEELAILNNYYTIRLYRLVRNICITGEEETVKTYHVDGHLSNIVDSCKEEELIHGSKEDTKRLLELIIDSIVSKKHSIRPFYLKYSDETLISIFSLNLVVTIDDERYLVHIENYYPRPNAVDTLQKSLDKYDTEMTERYISQTRTITGSSEFEQLMKDDYSLPDNWKF